VKVITYLTDRGRLRAGLVEEDAARILIHTKAANRSKSAKLNILEEAFERGKESKRRHCKPFGKIMKQAANLEGRGTFTPGLFESQAIRGGNRKRIRRDSYSMGT